MLRLKPQSRFLLRGTALLIGFLTLWWFLLLTPLLYSLQGIAGLLLHIETLPSGDWRFRVPFEKTIAATASQPAQQVHSIEFEMARSEAITFTFSLPLYWAFGAAASGFRRNLTTLAKGTALMAVVELALLTMMVYLIAQRAASQLGGADPADVSWGRRFSETLVLGVFPYLSPVVLALSLHRELREQIFGSEAPAVKAQKPVANDGRRKKKHR